MEAKEFDLDPNDDGLKAVMGDKFWDMSPRPAKTPKAAAQMEQKPVKPNNPAKTREEKPMDASWEPVKPDPGWMDKLKACAKWAALFGGLCTMFFYWQQAGLMDTSAAMPSMITCGVLAGYGVGKNATR